MNRYKFLSNTVANNLSKLVRYKHKNEQNKGKEIFQGMQQNKHEFGEISSKSFKLELVRKPLQTKNLHLFTQTPARNFSSDEKCGNSKTDKGAAKKQVISDKKKKPYWQKVVDDVCNRKKCKKAQPEEYKKCGVKSKCKPPEPPCSKKNERTTCEIPKRPCNEKDKCEKYKKKK